jgi:galactokinase
VARDTQYATGHPRAGVTPSDSLDQQIPRVGVAFREWTEREPDGFWAAPGRVNLIGDHTDYNDGLVLPLAIDRHVVAAVARRDDDRLRIRSLQREDEGDVALSDIRPGVPSGWPGYVAGVAWALAEHGIAVAGFDLVLDGAIPPGAGLASSAAIECVTALALADLYGTELDRRGLALLARRAEVEIVGVPCGVMDQVAVMCCRTSHAMFLDTRSLAIEHVPLSSRDVALLVIDVRAPHRLVDGEYASRRADCEAAARSMGVAALRDATASDVDRLTDERLRRRARHVVTEDDRVLDVVSLLRRGDVRAIGPVLTDSHVSLRDDYDVSTRELNAAVERCLGAGALGARLTGAGFGGCAIALFPSDRVDAARRHLISQPLGDAGERPVVFAVTPVEGARRIDGGPSAS